MSKILVGCWDCDYCGADRISGEVKICPKCGKPRGKDITFYMAGPKEYVKDPDQINKNPDWLCPYCSTLNPDENKFCSACGAARAESEQNYFESKEEERKKKEAREEAERREQDMRSGASARSSGSRLPILAALIAAIFLLVFLLIPKNKGMYVDSKTWERTISVDRYQETEDSGWDLPGDAWDVTSKEEIYTYNSVLDHYETRTREVSEQVFDGYDISTEYKDLGNGYFEEVEVKTPRYRTEYHTETYEEPVYVKVPVYKTRYYYKIMKWLYDRDETTSGADNEPYFAELKLTDQERESGRQEKYWIISGGKTYKVSYDNWKKVNAGDEIEAKVKRVEIRELEKK